MNLILNDEPMGIINDSLYDTLSLKEGQKAYHVRAICYPDRQSGTTLAESV